MKILRQLALFLCMAIMLQVPAHAQSWDGTGEVTPTWNTSLTASTWTPPIAVDAAHPADAYEPSVNPNDGVLYDRELWVSTPTNGQRTQINSTVAKWRTNCAPSFIKRADPILARGAYPALHAHTFFGTMDPVVIADVENFDYNMGRDNPASRCQGGPLNNSLYWEPSVQKDYGSATLTVMPDVATFYYTLGTPAEGQKATRLRRNLRFIGGVNPSDFNDTATRAEYTAGGVDYPGGNPPDGMKTPAGWEGISCNINSVGITVEPEHALYSTLGGGGGLGIVSTTQARYVKGPNGEDPWAGRCNAPGLLIIGVNAQECWDGNNLGSIGGRRHMRYAEGPRGGSNPCPTNFVKVPHFETKIQFSHNGWSDFRDWYFSSDRMRMASTECPDASAPCDGVSGGNVPATVGGVYYSRSSFDPCRKTGLDFCNMATGHFDWWGSQDQQMMNEWNLNCVGMIIGGVDGIQADCGSGGLDGDGVGGGADRDLLTGGPAPEPNLSPATVKASPSERASGSTLGQRYFPISPRDATQGPLEVDVHPHHGPQAANDNTPPWQDFRLEHLAA